MQELGYAVVGWLAGILSAVIFDIIQRGRLAKSLRKALGWEIEELRYGLAIDALWLISFANLDRDDELFGWIAQVHATYAGIERDPAITLEAELWLTSPERRTPRRVAPSVPLGRRIVMASRRPTPALDRSVQNLEIFSQPQQVQMLALQLHMARAQLFIDSLLNEQTKSISGLPEAVEQNQNAGVFVSLAIRAMKSASNSADQLRSRL
jgi:hypothetical protein